MKVIKLKPLIAEATNNQVIDLFVNDSFPKDKRPVWGTKHLKLRKETNGWSLVNYATPILFRDKNGKVYFNTQSYSKTTTTLQNYMKRALAGENYTEVDGEGIKSKIQ